MNKKMLAGLNATLIGAYSQLLHLVLTHYQITFEALPAIIGIVSAILTYWTALLLICLNLPNVSTFSQKVKIKAAISRLEKRNKKLANGMPEKETNLQKIAEYQQLLIAVDDREIQQLMAEGTD